MFPWRRSTERDCGNENGLSYKFGADYVQSMTFEQVSQGSDLKVNSLGTDVYSGGNATLTFDLSDGGKLVCDLYGPADTSICAPESMW